MKADPNPPGFPRFKYLFLLVLPDARKNGLGGKEGSSSVKRGERGLGDTKQLK